MVLFNFLRSLFRSIFQTKSKYDFESTDSIIAYWDVKKRKIRTFFALFIIIFNLFGFELSTPQYSLTSELATILTHHIDFISSLSKKISPPKNLTDKTVTNADYSKIIKQVKFGQTIKWLVYGIFIVLFIFVFINADPFSKKHLILEIIEEEKYKERWKLPNFKDIQAYAKIAPSNVLFFRCQDCVHSNHCKNSLVDKGYKRNDVWTKIFIELSPETVFQNLYLVNQCRKWHFLKYSFLLSTISLLVVFVIIRACEFYLTNLFVIQNWQLLLLIIGSLITFFILDKIDPSLKELRDHLGTFYCSTEFKTLFKEKNCLRKDPTELYCPVKSATSKEEILVQSYEKQIKCLKMTIDHFDLTTVHRIDKLVDNLKGGDD
ncbi:hypothetical protein [Desulfobacter curvatus]|uniref:hypothetical protein n=1 Tax=Desulfobacter curvatus TaxID=2290 RepID=UPI00036CB4C1|nr:hypothetical protein [Desulfobacter curvatus]